MSEQLIRLEALRELSMLYKSNVRSTHGSFNMSEFFEELKTLENYLKTGSIPQIQEQV